ncbi:septation regulator SpoVG [Halothermothrix orenii]|uniref:SpoVG family protein n=1 Tax=Halothermothrix orenii (strain H 168 / OCM 544 / DSM 9562) TaxID=373903 RepID=B8D019_HALOH|nr:septation regulator SpoVG [Halothermothrix orenii]ACL70871.1 SpoVG family protein [Halothermothrix orenii H 168]
MEITEVRIYPFDSEGATRAFASITFDNSFVVRDIRVVDGKKGLFVSMPAKKTPKGEFKDICHPITNELRETIQKTILDKYEQEIA